MLLAKDPDVRAEGGCLVVRDLIDAAAPSGHYVPACQVTLYDPNGPGWLTYRFAASIASALQVTRWNGTLLGPDPSRAIARLKDQPGKDLIKYGTSRFDDTLVRDHLIDEFRFWIMPVVAGAGRRLFEGVDTSGLDLRLTGQKEVPPSPRSPQHARSRRYR